MLSSCIYDDVEVMLNEDGEISSSTPISKINYLKIPINRRDTRHFKNVNFKFGGLHGIKPTLFAFGGELYAVTSVVTVKLTGDSIVSEKVSLFVRYLLKDCFYKKNTEGLFWLPGITRSRYCDTTPVYKILNHGEGMYLKFESVEVNNAELEAMFIRVLKGFPWDVKERDIR